MKTEKSTAECAAYNLANKEAIDLGLLEAQEPTVRILQQEATAVRTVAQHHAGWQGRGCSVLPIGTVNFVTGKNKLFGTVWDGWAEDQRSTNILLRSGSDYIVVHTSGGGEGYKAGDTMSLKHDQTFRRIGHTWTVVGMAPHTPEGMLALKQMTGQNGAMRSASLRFYTFK